MKRRVREETWLTLAVAMAGFGALILVLPDWATTGVLSFGVLYGVLVVFVDDGVRALFVRKARAKPLASRRAAT